MSVPSGRWSRETPGGSYFLGGFFPARSPADARSVLLNLIRARAYALVPPQTPPREGDPNVPKISRAAGAAAAAVLALGAALAAGVFSGPATGQRSVVRAVAADEARPGAAIGPGPGRRLVVRPLLAAGLGGAGVRGEAGVRPAEASADSLNSAGYAASRGGTRFRLVRATFFVPYLNCALSKGAFSDEWVGLGGFVGKSVTVQQVGIQADCDSAGRGAYRAWRDMYPNPEIFPRLRIRAGDSVTASVFYDATTNMFDLSLTDNTTGGRFSVSRGCPAGRTCPASSAEIISSAPTRGSGRHLVVKPLADYGAVSYAAIAITDRSGQRSGLRSAFWGATRIIQTEGSAPFRVVSRPTQIQANTFDTYWSREN
jgi:hypothetical protein